MVTQEELWQKSGFLATQGFVGFRLEYVLILVLFIFFITNLIFEIFVLDETLCFHFASLVRPYKSPYNVWQLSIQKKNYSNIRKSLY